MTRVGREHAWLFLALPGLLQVFLLATAFVARVAYPYDLEWMEGGMLVHAHRAAHGLPIYAAPSVDFVPFLYTPLYPMLLAWLGKIFPLGYALGRSVSVASTLAILLMGARAVDSEASEADRWPARAAALCAWGLFAACYPWVECFFDLVRGDMFALALGMGGLVMVRAWGPTRTTRGRGFLHGGAAAAAALLGVSFFAKQTGFVLVGAGGLALVVMNWRALPIYGAVAGAIGLGGSAIANVSTHGWYWVYIFQVHQNHDTNTARFWRSFDLILTHFPLMTLVVGLGLVAVIVYASARRRLPPGGAGFLYWAWLFGAGTLLGAIGWSTQWAVFNAFIPAMAFGAIAAACAVAPLAAAAAELVPKARAPAAAIALAMLGAQLLHARWDPRWSAPVGDGDSRVHPPPPWHVRASVRPFIPTAADRAAGDQLIARLRTVDGPIFYPSHPWYPILAGQKAAFVTRIGIKDVTFELPCLNARRQIVLGRGPGAVRVPIPCIRKAPVMPPETRVIAGLVEALTQKRFAAIVLDHGESPGDYPGMPGRYKQEPGALPGPRVFSGKPTTPGTLWLPAK